MMIHRILIVEDEQLITELVSEALVLAGFEVIAAKTTDEALEFIDSEQRIDLLFTDLGLPGTITGTQMIKQAMTMRPSMAIVYTTGYAEEITCCPKMPVLWKPYRMAALLAIVRAQFATV